MTAEMQVTTLRWWVAKFMMEIWHPDKVAFIRNPMRRRYMQMEWRVRGVVLHDRSLNGEWDRIPGLGKP